MAKTLQDKYVEGAIENGFCEVESRSRKYRVFQLSSKNKLFLGKRGAVRIGRNATASRDTTARFKYLLLYGELRIAEKRD